jgi:hypothetical protein
MGQPRRGGAAVWVTEEDPHYTPFQYYANSSPLAEQTGQPLHRDQRGWMVGPAVANNSSGKRTIAPEGNPQVFS